MARLVNLANYQQFTAINVLFDGGHIPGPKIVPQCAAINLVWTLGDGKIAHNVLGGRYTGGFAGTVAQCNAIMTALTTGVNWTSLAAHLAPQTALSAVTITDLNVAGSPTISSTNTAVPGTSTGTMLPNEVAAVVTFRTARTGPRYRGRMYLPGFATTALATGDVIAPAALTGITNFANAIPGAFTAQGYTHCLALPARAQYTGTTGTLHPARSAETPGVTSWLPRDNHWDSQRRRGLK